MLAITPPSMNDTVYSVFSTIYHLQHMIKDWWWQDQNAKTWIKQLHCWFGFSGTMNLWAREEIVFTSLETSIVWDSLKIKFKKKLHWKPFLKISVFFLETACLWTRGANAEMNSDFKTFTVGQGHNIPVSKVVGFKILVEVCNAEFAWTSLKLFLNTLNKASLKWPNPLSQKQVHEI